MRSRADYVFETPHGEILYYKNTKKGEPYFVAVCPYGAAGECLHENCRMSRREYTSPLAFRAGQGKPLGLLYYYLKMPDPGCKELHWDIKSVSVEYKEVPPVSCRSVNKFSFMVSHEPVWHSSAIRLQLLLLRASLRCLTLNLSRSYLTRASSPSFRYARRAIPAVWRSSFSAAATHNHCRTS